MQKKSERSETVFTLRQADELLKAVDKYCLREGLVKPNGKPNRNEYFRKIACNQLYMAGILGPLVAKRLRK